MPNKDGGLTRTESDFLEAYAATGSTALARSKTGMPRSTAYGVLARPEVQARMVQIQTAKLMHEALPVAVQTLIDVMGNAKAPAAARVQAAKVVLDRTLPIGEGGQVKELHELTPAELAQQIDILEAKAANLATAVNAVEIGVFD